MLPRAVAEGRLLGPFHVHRGHDFEGFQIEERRGVAFVIARCACGQTLDVAEAAFIGCPACAGDGGSCRRCGGTGSVIDHAALCWRLPD